MSAVEDPADATPLESDAALDARRLPDSTEEGSVTAVGEVEAERAGSRARRPRFDRFAELAETGQIAVNLPTTGWDVHMPFGGFRESGSAFEEQGLDALRFYTRTKTVAVHFDG